MLFKRRDRAKNSWQIEIPEKHGHATHIINTSPVVLGGSMQCDIVIKDPSVCESHIQFVLIKSGKYLEIYDLSIGEKGAGERRSTTLLDGAPVEGKRKLAAKEGANHALKAGNVDLKLTYGAESVLTADRKKYQARDRDIDWFYLHDGVEYGPARIPAMIKAIKDGDLLPLDDAWHSGISSRIKAFEVPDLFAEKSMISDSLEMKESEKQICPYCWHGFKPEELLYIARHNALLGDPVLGYDEQQRFVPRRLKPVRRALDARGEVCHDMACPRCHLRIPTPFLDSIPLFFSIIGAPGCGKSYYLATSTWKLRTVLPGYFGLNFEDIDNVTNQWINGYEEKLFLQSGNVGYSSIEKTQIESGQTSIQVKINAVSMFLPQPAMFSILSNRRYHRSDMVHNTLAFYDNAGEHFQTGQDIIQKPGTLHILKANALIFLFDPTADTRFTKALKLDEKKIPTTSSQQQKIVQETIDRIRKHTGLSVRESYRRPVVVGISKADLLIDYLSREDFRIDTLPYRVVRKGSATGQKKRSAEDKDSGETRDVGVLDMSHIRQVSAGIRELFLRLVPEFVNTVEAFAEDVIYLPISAIGHQPDEKGVHPGDIHPVWVEVPFLYILSKMGYIPYITT